MKTHQYAGVPRSMVTQSMATIPTCDRCDEYLALGAMELVMHYEPTHKHSDHLDLCATCAQALVEWLES